MFRIANQTKSISHLLCWFGLTHCFHCAQRLERCSEYESMSASLSSDFTIERNLFTTRKIISRFTRIHFTSPMAFNVAPIVA